MSLVVWGLLPKSAEDPTKIEEEIEKRIADHNNDPDAHGLAGMALYAHRTGDVLDHLDEAVRNAKIYHGARAYTALVEAPTIQEHILRPNGPGSETNIYSQYPDSGEHWDKVDEATADDDETYVYDSVASYVRDLYSLPPCPFSENPIYGIRVFARCRANPGSPFAGHFKVVIKTHGQVYEGPPTAVGGSYTTISAGWNLNPYTKDLWTKEEIDNLEIGIAFEANNNTDVRCTQVYVIVEEVTNPGKGDFWNIEKAIEYVKDKGGGIVFVREGVYKYYEDIDLYDNVALIGLDRETAIIDFNATDKKIKAVADTSSYTEGTISVTSDSDIVTGSGTSWPTGQWAGRYISINHVWYKIKSVDSPTQITLERVYRGPTLSGLNYRIAWLYHGIEIKNLTIRNSSAIGGGGIYFDFVIDSIISNCFLDNNRIGIELKHCDGIVVTQNLIRNCGLQGIRISGGVHITVTFNECSNISGVGIYLSGLTYSEIRSNKCMNLGDAGIGSEDMIYSIIEGNFIAHIHGGEGIYFGGAEYCAVIGNEIRNASGNGIFFEHEAQYSNYNVITGNIIYNNGSYGIRIYNANFVGNIITANIIRNNADGAIYDAGTDTEIAHNIE